MKERTGLAIETILAIIVCVILWILTFFATPSVAEDKMLSLFARYNPKQSLVIAQTVRDIAAKKGVNPNVIAAIIVLESGVSPRAKSRGGDYGLMQIRWKIHRKTYPSLKNAHDLYDIKTNIRIGTDIFARYYSQTKSIRKALIKYNGGSGKLADRALKIARQIGDAD